MAGRLIRMVVVCSALAAVGMIALRRLWADPAPAAVDSGLLSALTTRLRTARSRDEAGDLEVVEEWSPRPARPTLVTDPPAEPSRVEIEPPWVEPVDGGCPDSHPLKAKLRSQLFHAPGMSQYGRTNADRCYSCQEDAEADGFTRAKR
jgi:hypothetical protein